MRKITFTIFILFSFFRISAQNSADSLAVETTLEELITVCNSVMPEGENGGEIIFERLAPYVLYTGADAARKNKSGCDYNKVEDRKLVNGTGNTVKNWLEQISDFKVTKYQLVKKDNLDWHCLTVSFKPVNGGKNKLFYFIKVKDKFLLGKME